MSFFYLFLLFIAVVIVWLVFTFNRLVVLRMRSKEALSDVDVQLKRRFDLIPNLVETVKGYMEHEKETLTKVTEARSQVAEGGNALEREKAENVLSNTLKTLFAVAEGYPDLKANANFLDLQRELADTENKIQASRRFYNTTTMELNTKIEVFPTNLLAGILGFKKMEFFKAEDGERENVKVTF
ncbi:MAG: LemA family protein [Candidatus Pacebacteria bacterium]|nr:LemA family protein [Candidatus Paceibacterota bacterium]